MDGLIYAYHAPKSTAQRAYTEARLAQLAAERRERKTSTDSRASTESASHASLSPSAKLRNSTSGDSGAYQQRRDGEYLPVLNNMDLLVARAQAVSSSTISLQSNNNPIIHRTLSEQTGQDLSKVPFDLRHGRRYLKDVPYPLPCDLAELQRQNLRTLLAIQTFGRTVCCPKVLENAPKKVLDIGCGSGYWSAMCHDYLSDLGHDNVEFTGLDIVPLAPNLKKQGVNWRFVQHDVRRTPFPFDDEEFDLVVIKDLSLCLPLGPQSERALEETIRIIRPGGTLEVWDSDHLLRSLLPDSPPPPSNKPHEQDVAEETATFAIAPGHPFAPAQNKYLRQANHWISDALDRRKLHPTPCVRFAEMLLQELDLEDVGTRRVAIPLGELRWERKASKHKRTHSNGHDSPLSVGSREKPSWSDQALTPDQAALRHTALMTVLQGIESMEPLLKEVSGKNAEEWNHWWASMMTELLGPSRDSLRGECLEIGAWWATKVSKKA